MAVSVNAWCPTFTALGGCMAARFGRRQLLFGGKSKAIDVPNERRIAQPSTLPDHVRQVAHCLSSDERERRNSSRNAIQVFASIAHCSRAMSSIFHAS